MSSATSAACLFCLGAGNILASGDDDPAEAVPGVNYKFLKDSHMTYEDVFKFTYASWFIITMKVLAEDMGEDTLNEMLKKASSETARRIAARLWTKLPNNSLSAFARLFEKPSHILENGANYEIVENSGSILELKVTECLWAKVFRDADAARIG